MDWSRPLIRRIQSLPPAENGMRRRRKKSAARWTSQNASRRRRKFNPKTLTGCRIGSEGISATFCHACSTASNCDVWQCLQCFFLPEVQIWRLRTAKPEVTILYVMAEVEEKFKGLHRFFQGLLSSRTIVKI